MTDRDRLINELKKAKNKCLIYESGGCLACKYRGQADCTIENIADQLLANGVIVPPCKVGDTVYYPSGSFDRIFEKTVDEILISENESDVGCYIHFASTYMPFENIGKTVFLTKEEAEEKLNEMNKGE